MNKDIVIKAEGIGKMYKIYKKPRDKFWDAMGLKFGKKNYYNEFWALRGLNIEIRKGEKVGLIGRNGAGKSTFLKTIIGSVQPTEGNIKINGKIQALMELGTGFHPEFTGRENIRASLAYNGLTKKEIIEKEEEIIDFSELEEFIDRPIKTYSAGMLARLGFSTATSIEPEVLIIDEVLGAGDAYFAGKCVERMKKLTDESGATVLFVSHDLGSLQMLCDRSIWIDRGRVVEDGPTLEVIKSYSEEVRKAEELRQKARGIKLANRNSRIIDTHKDLYDTYLFRFCTQEGSKIGENKIRKLTIMDEHSIIGEIQVGDTMDNNKEYESFIISDIGLMQWSESKKDEEGYYRYYKECNGQFKHAPFQFSIPKGISKDLALHVEGKAQYHKSVRVEMQDSKSGEYKFIGYLDSDKEKQKFILTSKSMVESVKDSKSDEEIQTNEMIQLLQESRDIKFTEKCRIEEVAIFDRYSNKKVAFSFEDSPYMFQFRIRTLVEMKEVIGVFLVFNEMGVIVYSQTVAILDLKQMENTIIKYTLSDIKLGAGEYNISFAIYEELNYRNNSVEQEWIALIDRAIFFKVDEPIEYKLGTGKIIPIQMPVVVNSIGEKKECHSVI